jgi:hypothetical protein
VGRFFSVLSVILWASLAQAQPLPGYDVLALARYCPTYLKAPKLPAVSTLLSTFGNPLPCIEQRIKEGGLQLIQIDLIDATCWRNKKCPAGVPKPDDLRVIEARAREVSVYAERYPGIRFQASPALEHDIKDAGRVALMLAAAKKGCPRCEPVNSPYSGSKQGGKLELHGTTVKAPLVSGDGASSFDADNIAGDGNGYQHRISGTDATFVWWNELNLRTTGEKTFTPPLKRAVRPTLDQFVQAYRIAISAETPIPAAPRLCKRVQTVNGKEILKTNAEQYGNGVPPDVRGNKSMLILRKGGKKGDRMKVYSPAGKEIGCFKLYGPYSEKPLMRWYMGDCSGETPAQLYKEAGGEWAFVDLGRGDCLRINTIRRMGLYR